MLGIFIDCIYLIFKVRTTIKGAFFQMDCFSETFVNLIIQNTFVSTKNAILSELS